MELRPYILNRPSIGWEPLGTGHFLCRDELFEASAWELSEKCTIYNSVVKMTEGSIAELVPELDDGNGRLPMNI